MSLSPEYMRPDHADSPVRLAKCWWRKARYNRLLLISLHTRSGCKMPCSKGCFPMTMRIQLSKKKERKREEKKASTQLGGHSSPEPFRFFGPVLTFGRSKIWLLTRATPSTPNKLRLRLRLVVALPLVHVLSLPVLYSPPIVEAIWRHTKYRSLPDGIDMRSIKTIRG
jgi:hypothetical protein